MIRKEFLGLYFICYYNLILPAVMIFGSVSMIIFSIVKQNGGGESTIPLLVIFVLICLLHIFSAIKYLRHEKIGRYFLIFCSLIQVFFSIRGLLTPTENTAPVLMLNLGLMLIGLWATWYLNTERAKKWLQNKTL